MDEKELNGGVRVSEIKKFLNGRGKSEGVGICTTVVFLTDRIKPIYWHAYPKHVNLARKNVDPKDEEVRKWFRDEPVSWNNELEQKRLMLKLKRGLERGKLLDRGVVERIRPENIIQTVIQHINEEEPKARIRVMLLPGDDALDKKSERYGESKKAFDTLYKLTNRQKLRGKISNLNTKGVGANAKTIGSKSVYNDRRGRIHRAVLKRK